MFNHKRLASTTTSKRKVSIVSIATVILFIFGLSLVSADDHRRAPSSINDMNSSSESKAEKTRKGKAAHAKITEYTGPETCIKCHKDDAQDMHGSVHYQQTGLTPNATNIESTAGKAEDAFNTYCGSIRTSPYFTCAGCHVGNGLPPEPEQTEEQLNNIDCLMCHQDDYARTGAPPFMDFEVVGEDQQPAIIQIPVPETFRLIPDESKMTISILEAAQTVHPTTRKTCLRCHAGASGSDGGKRGDLSSVTVDPPISSDVHMSSHGEDLTCSACHNAGNHRVGGRGLDLRPNDVAEPLVCSGCHTEQPHKDNDSAKADALDLHASRVACQTCHIPTFAKDISTEMERDWLHLHFSETACGGRGGWVPEEIRESNVIPTYKWYDGTSNVYVLGEIPNENEDGEKAFGVPHGAVNTANAKIHPMKEHRAEIAQHTDSQKMIPHSTFALFTQASFDTAIREGMAMEGLEGDYNMVPVHTYQTINHGVEGKETALKCRDCHSSGKGRGQTPPRMDLKGELGYELKDRPRQVCSQCHNQKKLKKFKKNKKRNGFMAIHKKHVAKKKIDCSACHSFSREEERGLNSDITDFQDKHKNKKDRDDDSDDSESDSDDSDLDDEPRG